MVRSARPNQGYHNVCSKRGRRPWNTPGAQLSAGERKCLWRLPRVRYDWTATCTLSYDEEDDGALTESDHTVEEVKVDTWGGWIFHQHGSQTAFSAARIPRARAAAPRPIRVRKRRYKVAPVVICDCKWKTATTPSWSPTRRGPRTRNCSSYGQLIRLQQRHDCTRSQRFDEPNPALR